MSGMSLLAIVLGLAFVAYGVWVLTYAFKHDKEDASPEEMVDGLRKGFRYSA